MKPAGEVSNSQRLRYNNVPCTVSGTMFTRKMFKSSSVLTSFRPLVPWVVALLLLTACGQKGELYLPSTAPGQADKAATSTKQDKDGVPADDEDGRRE